MFKFPPVDREDESVQAGECEMRQDLPILLMEHMLCWLGVRWWRKMKLGLS